MKGASILFMHSGFDVAKGVAIDSLHVVFLGITLDLLHYWFDKKHQRKDFSIKKKVRTDGHNYYLMWVY